MSPKEVTYGFEQFQKALARLEEAVAQSRDDLDRDGVIQRFEFTFERCWKALKVYLMHVGKACGTPREALKEGFRQGLVADEQTVLNMLEDRNLSSHTYDERTALQIFEHIQNRYLPTLKQLSQNLGERVKQLDAEGLPKTGPMPG